MKFLNAILPFSGAESRKAQVLIVAAVVALGGKAIGLSEKELTDCLYLAIAYITGQGLADLGKGVKEGK